MLTFESIREKLELLFNGEGWIKWLHFGADKPAETSEEKAKYAFVDYSDYGHCAQCLNLNGCFFPVDNMPKQPLHIKCHCKKKEIKNPRPYIETRAQCSVDKFTVYVFQKDKAKKRFFESNGYGIMDSNYLENEYEMQAAKKYANGEFELGLLDNYGQRITIEMQLPRRTGDYDIPLSVPTGWMVYPNGKIICTTPATNLSR